MLLSADGDVHRQQQQQQQPQQGGAGEGDGEYEQKSIRYTGRHIPGRSFRMLQNMTASGQHGGDHASPSPGHVTAVLAFVAVLLSSTLSDGSVAEWLARWTRAQKARVQIAAAALLGNSLRQTAHTHRASVHQAAKLVAALLWVTGATAGLAESNGSLPPGL